MLQTSESLTLTSTSAEITTQIGIELGQLLQAGDIVCLSGDLGAGKTALASGIGKGWGAREIVNSPTFVFIHEHHRAIDDVRLYHLDCYRMNNLDDADSVGVEDILAGEDVMVIEWPERIAALLPPERLSIVLEAINENEMERRLSLVGLGTRYTKLIDSLKSSENNDAAGN